MQSAASFSFLEDVNDTLSPSYKFVTAQPAGLLASSEAVVHLLLIDLCDVVVTRITT